MGRKVTCGYCHKKIDINDAYVVKKGKRNKYYCNEEHSILIPPRDIFYMKAFEVFGQTTNTAFYKEFEEIARVHGWEKMIAFLDENKDYLEHVVRKDFASEFAKIRYFAAVFKNCLHDFRMKKPEVKKEINVDIDISVNKYKKKEERKGMNDLLNDLLGD